MLRTLTYSLVLFALGTTLCWAGDTLVEVELADGRTFAGILDARTSNHSLWLRWRTGRAELQRNFFWHELQSLTLAGASLTAEQLQERAPELATQGLGREPRSMQNAGIGKSHTYIPASSLAAAPPRIATIDCEGWVGQWDADALLDGIALQITAYDREGQAVPFAGTVAAELVATEYQPGYQASTRGGRVPVALGRWSLPWHTDTTHLQLPYPQREPEREGALGRYGQLRIRVSIPGQGVFEREITALRLRPFTPVRGAQVR
jgi:hypothetical protein